MSPSRSILWRQGYQSWTIDPPKLTPPPSPISYRGRVYIWRLNVQNNCPMRRVLERLSGDNLVFLRFAPAMEGGRHIFGYSGVYVPDEDIDLFDVLYTDELDTHDHADDPPPMMTKWERKTYRPHPRS